MSARWPLKNNDRVYVASVRQMGLVAQVGRVEVAVWFKDSIHSDTRVFLYDCGIVPVDLILEQVGLKGATA